MISPETGRLPNSMGPLARYISGKSGGMGEVIAALCEGLSKRGIDCHLATLNLEKRFQRERNLNEASWISMRHRLDPERIHMVSSSILAGLDSACDGSYTPYIPVLDFLKDWLEQCFILPASLIQHTG